MKKVFVLLFCAFLFCIGLSLRTATASEVDDQIIASLLESATKIRSYGDFCWEMQFNEDWTLPENPLFPEGRNFSFYAMDVKVLDKPLARDYTYFNYIKQFIPLREREFKAGDRVLIVCLPKDFKFADFRERVFKPWIVHSKGTSDSWTFVKKDSKWLGKDNWHINHAWLTGTRAIQDFVCLGADDKNVIAIDSNSITFTPRTTLCFIASHHRGDNPYLNIWTDEDGKPMEGRSLESNEQVTLKVSPVAMPKGWD